MHVITVRFEVKPDKIEEFKALIQGHAKASLTNEPGCRQFDVSQDPENPAKFFLYEVYDDVAAFEAHRQTPHMAATGKKMPDLLVSRDLVMYTMLPGEKPQR